MPIFFLKWQLKRGNDAVVLFTNCTNATLIIIVHKQFLSHAFLKINLSNTASKTSHFFSRTTVDVEEGNVHFLFRSTQGFMFVNEYLNFNCLCVTVKIFMYLGSFFTFTYNKQSKEEEEGGGKTSVLMIIPQYSQFRVQIFVSFSLDFSSSTSVCIIFYFFNKSFLMLFHFS